MSSIHTNEVTFIWRLRVVNYYLCTIVYRCSSSLNATLWEPGQFFKHFLTCKIHFARFISMQRSLLFRHRYEKIMVSDSYRLFQDNLPEVSYQSQISHHISMHIKDLIESFVCSIHNIDFCVKTSGPDLILTHC